MKMVRKRTCQTEVQEEVLRLIDEISQEEDHKLVRKYAEELRYFYTTLGEFSLNVYLNPEVIEVLTRGKGKKPDLKFVMQLPFFLRFMEQQNREMANIFIRAMNLKEYINVSEKYMPQHYNFLEENKHLYDWVETFQCAVKLLRKMHKKGMTTFEQNVQALESLGAPTTKTPN